MDNLATICNDAATNAKAARLGANPAVLEAGENYATVAYQRIGIPGAKFVVTVCRVCKNRYTVYAGIEKANVATDIRVFFSKYNPVVAFAGCDGIAVISEDELQKILEWAFLNAFQIQTKTDGAGNIIDAYLS